MVGVAQFGELGPFVQWTNAAGRTHGQEVRAGAGRRKGFAQGTAGKAFAMVGVAQLVERRFVVPVVVGSIPIVHPNFQRPAGRNGDVEVA